jgi:hypothetical protein
METINNQIKFLRGSGIDTNNKWRVGEYIEYNEKVLENQRDKIIKMKKEKQPNYYMYIQELEKYIAMKNQLEAVKKTMVGLELEKIALLEKLTELDLTSL